MRLPIQIIHIMLNGIIEIIRRDRELNIVFRDCMGNKLGVCVYITGAMSATTRGGGWKGFKKEAWH